MQDRRLQECKEGWWRRGFLMNPTLSECVQERERIAGTGRWQSSWPEHGHAPAGGRRGGRDRGVVRARALLTVFVVDTSEVLEVIVAVGPPPGTRGTRSRDGTCTALYLIDVEVLCALRRLMAPREPSEERASDARADFRELAIVRDPHVGLSHRIWNCGTT